jgi:hypothetical protein
VTYWRLAGLALSGDGRHLAIVASSEDRMRISLLQMGEDTATGRWAVLSSREIEIHVPDAVPVAQVERISAVQISNLQLSPTGQHLAFEVHAKTYDFLVIDGEQGPHHERVKDLLDKSFIWFAVRDCHFETEDSVTCVVAKADGLYRVTQTAPSTSPWPVPAKH